MRGFFIGSILLLALLPCGRALGFDDPDTEVARRHFDKGRAFYDAQNYEAALKEFTAAKRARPAPGLDFNIARCYDRLEDYAAAITHYERYVASSPRDMDEVKERVRVLKQRVEEMNVRPKPEAPPAPPRERAPNVQLAPPAPQPVTTPSALQLERPRDESAHRRRTIGIAVGVAAGAALLAGAIAVGVVLSSGGAPPFTQTSLGTLQATP